MHPATWMQIFAMITSELCQKFYHNNFLKFITCYMIKLFSSRLLVLICFILSIGILTSCDKNDGEVKSDKVQLFSFGPTGAKHGDTLRFIGVNLTKVTSIQFTGTNATVNQADFKQQTSELIRLIVPQAAEKGYVTL